MWPSFWMAMAGGPEREAGRELTGTKAATEKQIAVKAHERKRQSGNVLDVVPEGTPTEVVEHRLPENERICAACGSKLVEIGKEVRRSLMMKPAKFWVREDVYYTYACKNCEQETGEANIVMTDATPMIMPRAVRNDRILLAAMARRAILNKLLHNSVYITLIPIYFSANIVKK